MTRFLSDKSVAEITDMSRTTVWRLSKKDPNFPKPVKIDGVGTRWVAQEIERWAEILKNKRGANELS